MDKNLLDETLACLDQRKWIMHFSKDCYATFLIDFWLRKNGPTHVRDLKKTQFGKLLERPMLKQLTAVQPVIDQTAVNYLWADKLEPLVVTLGQWGGRKSYASHQVSRKGYNLVLQVNLSEQWDYVFRALFNEEANHYMDCGHPISETRSSTLGWARIDFDYEANEILIEEIQSDLVRRIHGLKQTALKAQQDQCETFWFWRQTFRTDEVLTLLFKLDSIALSHWQEALLWSALKFCTDELGMDTIYYHTYETGALLKNIQYAKPPRSLYTDLPKKFCFTQTHEVPKILQQTKLAMRRLKTQKNPAFFKLAA